jgi:tRNA(Ile)-lysidine synthase
MPAEFEKNIAGFIQSNCLWGPQESILLAVSGGADSTALLYTVAAIRLKGAFGGKLLCAHINHQLRTDADADEQFVVAEADKLNITMITRSIDVRGFAHKNKLSIETAARQLRIETLLDIARSNEISCIATAHQKNDNAETVLQRLTRGTGFRGLAGIWPVRVFDGDVRFVRPMLCVRRDQVIGYLQKRGLKWRQDHTNLDCTYRRNYIRHKLMPFLQQQCSGPVVEQLWLLARAAQKFYSLVCDCTDKIWPEVIDCDSNGVRMDLTRFSSLHPAVKVELVRRSLISLGSGERDLTQEHFAGILRLAQQNISDRKIGLPGGFTACREYEKLIFTQAAGSTVAAGQITESIKPQIPGQSGFGDYLLEAAVFTAPMDMGRHKAGKTAFVEWFDFDKLSLPIEIRRRQTGDSFIPLGQTEPKKVGKFLTAQRVPQRMRKKTLIVADSEKIIWVWPIRMAEQAKITNRTRKILRLQITDTGTDH